MFSLKIETPSMEIGRYDLFDEMMIVFSGNRFPFNDDCFVKPTLFPQTVRDH
jgi:hypothetical protein